MTDIMNDETIGDFKKSWFLNAKVPSEDDLYERTEGVEEWSDLQFDDYDNIVQTHWDGSSDIKTLVGCRNLDFTICHIELKEGKLVVDPENAHLCRKLSEYDDGWQVYCCDEELLDYNGNITEELSEFDHVEDNWVYRIPYTDLDTNAYRNGEIVLTKEAEQKWKKILSGELEQPHYGRAASQQTGTLTDYFVTINEKGKNRDVALYTDSDGLYIKGDSLEALKVMSEEKFYIQTASGLAKDFSQIKPSPESWLIGKPKGYSMEAGFCDIVSKRKKGEDSDGNFDGNINKLDELLQL